MQGCHKTANTPHNFGKLLKMWHPQLQLYSVFAQLGMFHFVYFIQVLRGKKHGYMTVKELQTLSVFGSFFVTSNVLRTFSQPSKFNRIILCGHLSGKLCLTDHCCHIYGPLGKLFSSTSKVWPKWKEKCVNWICPFWHVNFYTSRMCKTVQGLCIDWLTYKYN